MSKLVGFKCPPGSDEPGRDNSIDFCIHKCQNQCLPTSVLWTIWQLNQFNIHKGDMVSPSALKGCPRKLILSRTIEHYEEPTKLYASTRGSLYHGFLECKDLPTHRTEARIWKEVTEGPEAPYKISGQIDDYDTERCVLADLKTTSEKAASYIYGDGPRPDHIAQINTYRWLMKGGHLQQGKEPDPADPIIFWPVNELVLHYIFMNKVITTGKIHREMFAQKASPNYGRKYRTEISREQIGTNNKGTPLWELKFDIPAVPMWTDEQVEAHVIDTAPHLVRGFRRFPEYWPPAPPLYNPDEAWQCNYCPGRQQCMEYEEKQKEAMASESLPFDTENIAA